MVEEHPSTAKHSAGWREVVDWRSAENKSNNYYGKISSFGHKIFFSLWRDGSSKKFTLRK